MRYLWILALVCVPNFAFGQATGVKGRILDRQGAVVAGMEITATDSTKKAVRTITKENGEYFFDLPTGEYTLEISNNDRAQFCPVRIKSYLVPQFNGVVTLDIILKHGKCSHCRNSGCEKKLKTIEF